MVSMCCQGSDSVLYPNLRKHIKLGGMGRSVSSVLEGTLKPLSGLDGMFAGMGVFSKCVSAVSLSTTRGTFYKGDLLLWQKHAQWHVGVAQLFLRSEFVGGQPLHFAYVAKLDYLGGPCWSQSSPAPMLLCSEAVRSAVPFQVEGTTVRVFMQTVL